jgi:hypothetical protein
MNENSLNKINIQIDENMRKAFFDIIEQTVNSDKPDYDWITKLYEEISNRLCQYLNPNLKTYKQIKNDFDTVIFHQMISNDVFNWDNLLSIINNSFEWVMKLQSPQRDKYTQEAKERVIKTEPKKIIATFLKEIHTCIDYIDKDMENLKTT